MLSYRHEYHAGNVADLVKHSTLTLILDYLKRKPTPIRYIDTHAGAGIYSTRSALAAKTGEYRSGVGAIAAAGFPASLTTYQNLLAAFVADYQYPGSPLIAATILRPQDELRLFELHNTDFPVLQNLFAQDRRALVSHSDGYESLKALLPVSGARALVLIDPSYETSSDYANVLRCVEQGYKRMPHAVFAIWYPVVNKPELEIMIRKIAGLVTKKLWRFELGMADTGANTGMTATGMLVINPPWTLATELDAAFSSMCPQLPLSDARFTQTCLRDESD